MGYFDDEYRGHPFTEVRNGKTFSVSIQQTKYDTETIIVSVNEVVVERFCYKRSYGCVLNTFFREVGRVHLGYYDFKTTIDAISNSEEAGEDSDKQI